MATAADVPGKFDVVINGQGYVFLDALEPNIPFRSARAIYGQTQPFVERSNVSNAYGDNAQDFFLTVRQRDWSLGEQQKFFRTGQDGRYWMGSGVDVSIAGQVSLSQQVGSLTFAAAANCACRNLAGHEVLVGCQDGHLYKVDVAGTITDLGAHGLGASPYRKYGMATDGDNAYLSTIDAGSVGVRKWNGSAFSTFSATTVGSLAFVDNTLYGASGDVLYRFDTAGVATALFTWQNSAGGAATAPHVPKLHSYGGKLLIAFPYAQESSELWIYDGVGVSRLEVFPENFWINDIEILYGIAYISGSFMKAKDASNTYLRPAVMFFDGSQIGLLWQSNDYNTTATAASNIAIDALASPSLGVNNGRVIFTDETTGNVMAYNPATGGVSSIGTFTANDGSAISGASTGLVTVQVRTTVNGYYFPKTTYPTSGYVISSLIDFESSLSKIFRGVTVEFAAASDGNGGTVDVAYQIDSLAGSWTSLATGVTSGTEVTFPSNTSGHAVAIKVTLNKGTSTSGPILKSMNVRGAPLMPIFPYGTYTLDCTGTADNPRLLRDGSDHPLSGHEQVQNLVTARNSRTPISVTDRVNGTYTGFVDVDDPDGFVVYETHAGSADPTKSGSFIVKAKIRGV